MTSTGVVTNVVTLAPASSTSTLFSPASATLGLHHRQPSNSAQRPATTTTATPDDTFPLAAPLLASDSTEETIDCRIKRYRWKPPADGDSVPYRPHAGEGSQYLRDFILGVNDGLISTFLLVVTTVAGGATLVQSLLTAISTAVAGAFAMGIGEYVATKSQLQVNDGEMRLESEHFKYHRDVELLQLRQFLESVNLSGSLLEAVVSEVGRDDESLMKMMMAFEFGVHADELERNPLKAMWMSGRLFLIGSLPTVLPFFIIPLNPHVALAIAAGLVGVTLFVVGAYKCRTTKGVWWKDGLENFVLGAIATGISYAVGVIFDKASGGNVS